MRAFEVSRGRSFWTLLIAAWIMSGLSAAHAGAPAAKATSDEAASQEALKETQALLKDPAAREAALKDNPDAAKLNENLKSLAGPQDSEEIYKISADIMGDLMKQSDGDPVKAMQLLQDAQKDPEHFGANLSPEQRAKIKAIAERIEAAQKTGPK